METEYNLNYLLDIPFLAKDNWFLPHFIKKISWDLIKKGKINQSTEILDHCHMFNNVLWVYHDDQRKRNIRIIMVKRMEIKHAFFLLFLKRMPEGLGVMAFTWKNSKKFRCSWFHPFIDHCIGENIIEVQWFHIAWWAQNEWKHWRN